MAEVPSRKPPLEELVKNSLRADAKDPSEEITEMTRNSSLSMYVYPNA